MAGLWRDRGLLMAGLWRYPGGRGALPRHTKGALMRQVRFLGGVLLVLAVTLFLSAVAIQFSVALPR